jgi:alkanesulfonate monooxygenase SsuD/methylene tetrahydromethanopterin reductase-like flavin-dependent oxidoreductase (luciferase family)
LDLSHYPQDQKLADMAVKQGSRGSFDVILQGTRAGGLTLGEAAKRFAVSELCPQIVGTPADVADQLQDLFESDAGDGLVLTPTVFPGTFEQFAPAVVPELQRRGIFRTEYECATLRGNLRAAR